MPVSKNFLRKLVFTDSKKKSTLSNQKLTLTDSVFEQMNENLPPLYRNLKDKIKDPSSKGRVESVVLLGDSTKIRCAKPSNRTKQSQLYYDPKGGQNITQLHLTTLDGTVVFVSSMAASSSPRFVLLTNKNDC